MELILETLNNIRNNSISLRCNREVETFARILIECERSITSLEFWNSFQNLITNKYLIRLEYVKKNKFLIYFSVDDLSFMIYYKVFDDRLNFIITKDRIKFLTATYDRSYNIMFSSENYFNNFSAELFNISVMNSIVINGTYNNNRSPDNFNKYRTSYHLYERQNKLIKKYQIKEYSYCPVYFVVIISLLFSIFSYLFSGVALYYAIN